MEHRPLGQTGLNVSIQGFGGMRIPNQPQDEVTELLNRALDLGVTYIDTAPGYGNSEELIGNAFEGRDTSGVVFSTKTNDKEADAVRARVETSLQRLKRDQISVLQLWGVNDREDAAKVLGPGGAVEGARKLQDEGLIAHLGFTTHALTHHALEVMESGEFVSVTGRYHYLDTAYDALREKAIELGMGYVAMTPLGQGWLARPSDALRAALGDYSPVEFALRYTAHLPGVTALIVGISNLAELEEAHAALGGELGDPAELMSRGDEIRETLRAAVGEDFCTLCGECLPCPANINIPELLRLNNLLRGYDLVDWGKDRYKLMGNAGNWYPGVKVDHCTKCGDCEPRCPEKLEITRMLDALHEELFEGERGRMSKED